MEAERRDQILANVEHADRGQRRDRRPPRVGHAPTAYEVRKHAEADYHLLQFRGPRELLQQLDHNLKITDGILRHRIIKLRPGTPPPPDLSAAAVAAAPAAASRPRRVARPRAALRRTVARSGTASRRASNKTAQSAGRTPDSPGPARRLGRPTSFKRPSPPKGATSMAATNINRVVLTGNLTRDPELRSTASGMSVCSLRIASNTRRKNQATGEWEDKPNFFDVTVWGAQGENCARFLSKGRPVALDGRLEWREWEAQDGNKRQSVEIVADAVQFLGGREDGGGNGGGGFTPRSDVPVDERDFQPAGAASRPSAPADDDIPF